MAGIVIIGAGHGGTQLAASLREEGFAGEIVLVSEETDLPYHKPPLSKSFMKTPDASLQLLRGEAFFDANGITLRFGVPVTAIERDIRRVRFADGAELTYDHLALATGTRARRLTLPGAELRGVHCLRTAEDARYLRAALPETGSVVVIGGGFIGLEAAAMLAGRGLSVTVLELAPRLLGRAVSAATASAVEAYLTGVGVTVRCGTGIEALIERDGHVAGVSIADEILPADLVIAGIGAVPNVDLAEASGLDVQNGIVVNELLATNDPAISALGDCATFPFMGGSDRIRLESVQNATDQARALARTLTGKPQPYRALPWFWSDIGALKLQIAGFGATDEDILILGENGLRSVWRLKDGRPVAVETLNSAGEHMLARRMLAEGVLPDRDLIARGDLNRLKAFYSAAKPG